MPSAVAISRYFVPVAEALNFITGARSLDEWDDFCKEWHSQGGDEVLQLVQDYISK